MNKDNDKNNLMPSLMNNFIDSYSNFEDLKYSFDNKKGVGTISGFLDGAKCTTTIKLEKNGFVQTNSRFDTDISKSDLIEQVKSLYSQGYKQRQIAEMLNISQSTVSKYLKL